MIVKDIPTLMNILRHEGQLVEIDAPVDADLEIAEIHRRVVAANGPALLFTNVKGYDTPVVTNLFGTPSRAERAFGERPLRFVERAVSLLHEMVPPTLGKLWAQRDFFWEATKLGTRSAGGRGPVTQVVENPPQMTKIPMLRSWPQDGGHFVTLPLVYTEDPRDGRHNLGMYRIHRYDDATTGMHWQIGKGGGFHHHVAREMDQDLPVTLYVGGPPALILAAIAPLPENVPELMLASLLAGERLPMVDNPAGPHRLLANAEYAFVGRVPPREMRPEGPFGDHYGYYSYQHDYPVFHVDAVCRKKNPVWPATVVGKPRQEDFYIGDYLQELLSPLFPVVMPNVLDLWSYGETGHHSLAGAVVNTRYQREAVQAAFRILGEGQLSLTKFLWLTDSPVDLRDPKAVLEHLLCRFRPETDLYIVSNVSMDTLDYTGPEVNLGSKGIMLGLGEPWRDLPKAPPTELPAGITQAVPFCAGCLLVSGNAHAEEAGLAERIKDAFPDWPLVCIVDDARKVAASPMRFLWAVFTRFEPAADIYAQTTRVQRHHISYGGTILIDSRKKATYAEELFVDDDTRTLVDNRWSEYFPQGGVEMGDGDAGHLDEIAKEVD